MNKFLDSYDLPKLNRETINHLNRSITSNQGGVVINNLPEKKSPRLDRFTAKFYQTFKEELIAVFLKLFHKIKREGMLLNSFMKTILPSIQTRYTHIHTHTKKIRPVSLHL
jgi:hypothetical protein